MHISPKYLKIIKITLISLFSLIFVVGIIAFAKREAILKATVARVISKAKRDYNLNVKIKDVHFAGLKTVAFNDISVVPEDRPSLAYISNLQVGIKLIPLLFGNVKLSELKINDSRITLIKKDSIRNYDFLFKKNKDTIRSESKVNLAELANNLLSKMLNKIPDDMKIRNFDVSFTDDSDQVKFHTRSATIDGGDLKSTIDIDNNASVWHIQGDVDPDNKQLDLILFADGKKVELPFLERKFKLKLNFDTVHTQMKKVALYGDELRITGSWAIKNLLLNQPKIASNDIIVPAGSIDANMLIGENYIAIDSSSVIHLKEITANPYIKYTISPSKIYELKLHTGEMEAQHLFDSFPQGLFESLDGIKVAGKLQYSFDLYLDSSQPDSVKFDAGFKKKDFRIINNGKINLQKINGPFVFTPYESGKPVRNILVSDENPNYVPITDVSPYLKAAVMTAEDPSFYYHRGFVMEAFRGSIAADFKAKSFKRGGSTISMQLIKNVYLNREKTIARKIEEILIVWLIENTGVSRKERMFEVYLNLIEWGRNVYGIGEASRYYFNKHPSQLSLGESIFLANIVPRPKSSLYFFEPDGSLRYALKDYFGFIGGVMARRGLTEADTSGSYGFYDVRLKESLRTEITPLDFIATDQLLLDDDMPEARDILKEILSRKQKPDTINVKDIKNLKVIPKDTVKSPAELRKERREDRRRGREEP